MGEGEEEDRGRGGGRGMTCSPRDDKSNNDECDTRAGW